jgi:hypothetical protein
MSKWKATGIDLMGFVAPIAGYFLFGWRGALLALLIKMEFTFKF